ncbi:MAG: hypothetical protein JXI32_09960 [Deltaproteobacteria bacterium]|nr:hypothetical protein [Deltaproteobacteria bacterium]
MRWVEIISVRLIGEPDIPAIRGMVQGFGTLSGGTTPTGLRLYRHATVEIDVSIHIHWNRETQERPLKSPLGLRIADVIGEFGMVNHAIWIEDTDRNPSSPV